MSTNIDNAKKFFDLFNRRDLDGAVALCADNVVITDMALGREMKGRTQVKEFLAGWVRAFSDAKIDVTNAIDGGNTVVIQYTGKGKNDGPFGPYLATNKPGVIHQVDITKFDGSGKMIEVKTYWDLHSFLVQLGHAAALPMPMEGAMPGKSVEARP